MKHRILVVEDEPAVLTDRGLVLCTVLADDSKIGDGSFESFTISGTIVPEPMTLSLVGAGALALLRRKR